MTLGELIKQRRTELGMTQARLAELVGKSASAVRSWERGRAAPKGEATRSALAAVLGVTDDDLEAAIEGESLTFFSEPGRPLAADPTPTITFDPSAAVSSEAESGRMPGDATVTEQDLSAEPVVTDAEETSDAESDAADETGSDVVTDVLEDPRVDDSQDEPDPSATEADEPVDAFATDEGADPGHGDAVPVEETTNDPTHAGSEIEPDGARPDGDRDVPGPVIAAPDRSDDAPEQASLLVGAGAAVAAGVTRLVPRRRPPAPEVLLAPAPDVEPDPVSQDAWLYRRRLIMLAVFSIFLIITLRWALSGMADAVGEVLDNLRTGL